MLVVELAKWAVALPLIFFVGYMTWQNLRKTKRKRKYETTYKG